MLNEKLINLEVGAKINLFELDATKLGGGISRFTDAGRTVTFGGVPYVVTQLESSGWDWSVKGTPPRPQIKITNVKKEVSTLIVGLNDLKGATLTRKRTLSIYLDDGSQPNPGAIITPYDIYIIEKKLTHNNLEVSWQLVSASDQEGVSIPARQVLRNCAFIYRFYDSSLGSEDPFDYTNATCPYVDQNYFKKDGTVVTDPSLDKCGKHLSDCKLRFGEFSELPFGGFPGVSKVR